MAAIIVVIVIWSIISAGQVQAEKQTAIDNLKEVGVINIGFRGDIRPLCSYDEQTDAFEGLEKDIADEIINRLFDGDIIVNEILVNSETKDAFLVTGQLDISFGASLSGSTKGIVYSSSYYSDGSAFLVMEGTIVEESGLNGGTIGVVQDSYVTENDKKKTDQTKLGAYLKAHDINAAVKTYASYPEAIKALRDGQIDAMCANEIFLKIFGQSGMLILPERFIPTGFCVQIRTGLNAFSDNVNDVIAAMKKDGTMDALIEKWGLVNYALLKE